MEYRLLHHWNYPLHESEHRLLESAIALADQNMDSTFLKNAAAFISEHTQVTYAVIGVLSQDGRQIETKAFIKDGKELPDLHYPLQNSPCDQVLTQRFCYYPNNVQRHFPLDEELRELSIESYLGSIFVDDKNEPMGLIALMGTENLQNVAFAEHLILVLSPAIEEELAKLRYSPPAN